VIDMRIPIFALTALVGLASPMTGRAQTYGGMCDASAAVGLADDRFVVANDEDNVLRFYHRENPAAGLGPDLSKFLKVEKEADLEGAALAGDRIYWIGSHGRGGKNGDVQEWRHRFFATSAAGKPIGKPYSKLLERLTASRFKGLGLAEAATKKPEEGGLNIEALAARPDGGLLIGFRSPLVDGKAIVIPFKNPAAVTAGAKPELGEAMLVDLGGSGVRSLERVGDAYLIVAGPAGPSGGFALYRWSGLPNVAPARLKTLPLRPEALFVSSAGTLEILSDDGDEMVGAFECKAKKTPVASRSFRGATVTLP